MRFYDSRDLYESFGLWFDVVIGLYKSDSAARLIFFVILGLQFRQCRADGIELSTGALVYVILVCKDVVDFLPKTFYLFPQIEIGRSKRQFSQMTISYKSFHDFTVRLYGNF